MSCEFFVESQIDLGFHYRIRKFRISDGNFIFFIQNKSEQKKAGLITKNFLWIETHFLRNFYWYIFFFKSYYFATGLNYQYLFTITQIAQLFQNINRWLKYFIVKMIRIDCTRRTLQVSRTVVFQYKMFLALFTISSVFWYDECRITWSIYQFIYFFNTTIKWKVIGAKTDLSPIKRNR